MAAKERESAQDGLNISTKAAEEEFAATKSPRWITLLKLFFAAALVTALFKYDILNLRLLYAAATDYKTLSIAFSMLFVALLLGVSRWILLMEALGIALSFAQAFQIYCIGAFWGTFLPGGTSGDAVRTIYILRVTKGKRTGAVMSVIADRILGLLGLATVALVLLLCNYEKIAANSLTAFFSLMIAGLFLGIIISGVGFAVFSKPLRATKIIQAWEAKSGLASSVVKAIDVLVSYRENIPAILKAWGISLALASLLVGSVPVIASAFQFGNLGAVDYAIAGIFSMLANVVPLTPGGIGIGEGAFDQICRIFGGAGTVASYGTIFLGFRLVSISVNSIGAIAFVLYRHSAVRSRPSK